MEKRQRILEEKSKTCSPSLEERRAIIQLIQSTGIGPGRFFDLYHHYGSAAAALENFEEATQHLKSVKCAHPRIVDQVCLAHEKAGVRLVSFLDPEYPPLLKEIDSPPPMLSMRGSLDVFQRMLLGVVGGRNASVNGCWFVKNLVEELGLFGISVVSGFARGIDTSAHQASLNVGTIGVLAGGVDIVYPEENQSLYEKVQETGCLISEMPLGTYPQGRHFPRRNRLISGMGRAVLVSEARRQSGSMLTAQYALDQGRDVLAVPGSPLDPRCSGSNYLLKQGATLVTGVQDVLNLFGTDFEKSDLNLTEQKHSLQRGQPEALLAFLSAEPLPKDLLLEKVNMNASDFNALCSRLELEGKIICSSGGMISLCLKTK